jgi:hypothetical protein
MHGPCHGIELSLVVHFLSQFVCSPLNSQTPCSFSPSNTSLPLTPFSPSQRPPHPCTENLHAAVARTAAFLGAAIKPVLICGSSMRSARARAAMIALAERSGFPVAVMPNAKGQFPETHPNYIGPWWVGLHVEGGFVDVGSVARLVFWGGGQESMFCFLVGRKEEDTWPYVSSKNHPLGSNNA